MTKYTKIITATAGTILCLAFAACGQGSGAGQPVYVEIDASASNLNEQVRTQYAAAGMQAANKFLDQGSALHVSLFAGDVHAATLYEGELDPPSDLSGVERAKTVVPLRGDLEAGLRQGLGLERPDPEIAAGLRHLASGSDIRGNLGAAMEAAKADGGGLVVLASDGRDTAFGDLASSTVTDLTKTIKAGLPTDAQGVTVAIVGIGDSRDTLDTATTKKLVAAWEAACDSTGAACSVTSQIDLNGALN